MTTHGAFSKVGIHIIKGTNARLAPGVPVVVLYDCSPEYYFEVRRLCGFWTYIVWRDDGEVPFDVLETMRHPRTLFQAINEPHVKTPDQARLLARIEARRMDELHKRNLNAALFAPSVGQFEPSLWVELEPTMKDMRDGDAVLIHEYWGVHPRVSSWHTGRWAHVPSLDGVKIIVGEAGRDHVDDKNLPVLQRGARGWLAGGVSVKGYLAEIRVYNDIMETNPNVLGCALYTAGTENNNEWRDFAMDAPWAAIGRVRSAEGPWTPPTVVPPPIVKPTEPLPFKINFASPECAYLRDPANARHTQGYGENAWYYQQFGAKAHNGDDFVLTGPDAIVRCIVGGNAVVGYDPKGYGLYVYVRSAETRTAWVYAHLAESSASGAVQPGDPIGVQGYSGVTAPGGRAGTHVHIGMRRTNADGETLEYNNGYQGYVPWWY